MERKLFPFRRPNQQAPSIEDILPTTSPIEMQHQNDEDDTNSESYEDDVQSNEEEGDDGDTQINADSFPETLQSVESEHLDSYYDDEGHLRNFFL